MNKIQELIRAAELVWIRQELSTEDDWGRLFNAIHDAQDEVDDILHWIPPSRATKEV